MMWHISLPISVYVCQSWCRGCEDEPHHITFLFLPVYNVLPSPANRFSWDKSGELSTVLSKRDVGANYELLPKGPQPEQIHMVPCKCWNLLLEPSARESAGILATVQDWRLSVDLEKSHQIVSTTQGQIYWSQRAQRTSSNWSWQYPWNNVTTGRWASMNICSSTVACRAGRRAVCRSK